MVKWALMAVAILLQAEVGIEPSAELQYLLHSGWLVKTAGHVLVFDYVERHPSQVELPAELRLNVGSFDQRPVVVFVSHSHGDHFFSGLASWAAKRSNIRFVVGWPGSGLPGAKAMQPPEVWSSDGLRVAATDSTDEGVGFLVTVDGLTLLHGGDHARWVDSIDEAFMKEIRWLQGQQQAIDIALFAVATGGTCEPRPAIWEGVRAAAEELAPHVLIPMHVGCPDQFRIYKRFRDEVAKQLSGIQVAAPARLGQVFRYEDGRLVGE